MKEARTGARVRLVGNEGGWIRISRPAAEPFPHPPRKESSEWLDPNKYSPIGGETSSLIPSFPTIPTSQNVQNELHLRPFGLGPKRRKPTGPDDGVVVKVVTQFQTGWWW